MGLNEPMPVRYGKWLSHLARGDFGISLANATPVRDRIWRALPNTLLLDRDSRSPSRSSWRFRSGIYSAIKRNRGSTTR